MPSEPQEPNQRKEPKPDKNFLLQAIANYVALRDSRLDLERTAKKVKEKEDAAEQELWVLMEAMGFKSITTEEFGQITRSFGRHFNLTDFVVFRDWVKKNEEFDLLREEANKRHLRDWCYQCIKDGRDLPPGVDMHVENVIQIRGRHKETIYDDE